MFIYTVVASLTQLELRGRRKAPPDILSGGPQHDVMASYAWFQFSGKSADVVSQLVEALPHPARLLAQKRAKDRSGGDGAAGGRGGPVLWARYACEPYFFNELVSHGLRFLCMTDGGSLEEDIFDYLAMVKDTVLAALSRLGDAAPPDVRRAASMALVESLSRWTPSQAQSVPVPPQPQPQGQTVPPQGQSLPPQQQGQIVPPQQHVQVMPPTAALALGGNSSPYLGQPSRHQRHGAGAPAMAQQRAVHRERLDPSSGDSAALMRAVQQLNLGALGYSTGAVGSGAATGIGGGGGSGPPAPAVGRTIVAAPVSLAATAGQPANPALSGLPGMSGLSGLPGLSGSPPPPMLQAPAPASRGRTISARGGTAAAAAGNSMANSMGNSIGNSMANSNANSMGNAIGMMPAPVPVARGTTMPAGGAAAASSSAANVPVRKYSDPYALDGAAGAASWQQQQQQQQQPAQAISPYGRPALSPAPPVPLSSASLGVGYQWAVAAPPSPSGDNDLLGTGEIESLSAGGAEHWQHGPPGNTMVVSLSGGYAEENRGSANSGWSSGSSGGIGAGLGGGLGAGVGGAGSSGYGNRFVSNPGLAQEQRQHQDAAVAAAAAARQRLSATGFSQQYEPILPSQPHMATFSSSPGEWRGSGGTNNGGGFNGYNGNGAGNGAGNGGSGGGELSPQYHGRSNSDPEAAGGTLSPAQRLALAYAPASAHQGYPPPPQGYPPVHLANVAMPPGPGQQPPPVPPNLGQQPQAPPPGMAPVTGPAGPEEYYYGRRTTVAEERLRRRRLAKEQEGAGRGDDGGGGASQGGASTPGGGGSGGGGILSPPDGGSPGQRGRVRSVGNHSSRSPSPLPLGMPPQVPGQQQAAAAMAGLGSPGGKRQSVGILLPLDYSGMVEAEAPGGGADDPLLRELDPAVRDAIRGLATASTTADETLGVLVKFRDVLGGITLPRPAAVDYEQALKDAQRESIQVNGRVFQGDVEQLLDGLRSFVAPLVYESNLTTQVCQDIIRASSRTASGGDTYSVMLGLLARPECGDLLTPSGAESAPISIGVEGKGEVVITVENSFLLRKSAMSMGDDPMGGSGGVGNGGGGRKDRLKDRITRAKEDLDRLGERFRDHHLASKEKKRVKNQAWKGPGWSVGMEKDRAMSWDSPLGGKGGDSGNLGPAEDCNGGIERRGSECGAPGSSDDGEGGEPGVQLDGRLEVFLSLLDSSCKRRLIITCPQVERCSPQCILLGAGSSEVNGSYDLAGFRHGAPLYMNANGVTISLAVLGGRSGWVIGSPPSRIFYGQPTWLTHPPDVHWAVMTGGEGVNPPPTLMTHSAKRVKEKRIDIRELPTPRWKPGIAFPSDAQDTTDNLTGLSVAASATAPAGLGGWSLQR